MSLTLDEVRNIKFRMAKRSGYEVLDVDEFVDHVEEGLARLLEENENLKKQVAEGGRPAEQAAPAPEPKPEPKPEPEVETRTEQPVAQTPAPAGRETIVVTTSKEASAAVVRLVELSTDQAEKLVSEAEEDAKRIRDEANRTAHQVTTDARTRAERIESEARVNADRVRTEAQQRADQLDQETNSKRSELFGQLEREREGLTQSVAELRSFEQQYRDNLRTHLRQQLETVENHSARPAGNPALLDQAAQPSGTAAHGDAPDTAQHQDGAADQGDHGANGQTSDTPRLDALLGDQH